MKISLAPAIQELLFKGTVIPAHPLALTAARTLDEKHQRALTRYYMDAGAGGIAVGVHTTQFEIRLPSVDLYETVLRIAAEEVRDANLTRPFIKIAGIVGSTEQAIKEATLASRLGYDMVLLSNGGLADHSEDALIERARNIAAIMPIFGFYLQPAVGGRVLSFDFWKKFSTIENVCAIKVAAFNRYQTLDVVRAVCLSGRSEEVALYTGNDDHIVGDLLTTYSFEHEGKVSRKKFVGGLLGHWAFWTKSAVKLLDDIKKLDVINMPDMLTKGIQITDVNAAVFDAGNNFRGCISGINEILRRQGLMATNYCLSAKETLSAGQADEIDRVYHQYGDLHDDEFIKQNIKSWLKP